MQRRFVAAIAAGAMSLVLASAALAAGRAETADDMPALRRLLASSDSRQVILPRDGVYAMRSKLRIPRGMDVDFNGSSITRALDDRSSGFQIVVSPGSTIRNLTLLVPAGVSINRGINLATDASAYNLRIASVDQQPNVRTQDDAALNIHGDRVTVSGLVIENFDAALRCEGGAAQGKWSDVRVSSYVQAFDIADCSGFVLSGFSARSGSPHARTMPGHNGLTLRGARFGVLSDLDVEDAGEHGIYVAGSLLPNRDLEFSNVRVTRPGQCGLKIRNTAALTSNIDIHGLSVVDAHFGNKPGRNEDGLRIEHAENVLVTGLSIRRQRNRNSSAFDGVFITRSRNVRIEAPDIRDVQNAGIHIDDEGHAQTLEKIEIVSPRIVRTVSGHGIHIRAGGDSRLRDIEIRDAYIERPAGFAIEFDADDSAVVAPVLVSGTVHAPGSGISDERRKVRNRLLEIRLEAAGKVR